MYRWKSIAITFIIHTVDKLCVSQYWKNLFEMVLALNNWLLTWQYPNVSMNLPRNYKFNRTFYSIRNATVMRKSFIRLSILLNEWKKKSETAVEEKKINQKH